MLSALCLLLLLSCGKLAQNVRRYEVCRKSIGFAEKAVQMIRL